MKNIPPWWKFNVSQFLLKFISQNICIHINITISHFFRFENSPNTFYLFIFLSFNFISIVRISILIIWLTSPPIFQVAINKRKQVTAKKLLFRWTTTGNDSHAIVHRNRNARSGRETKERRGGKTEVRRKL